MTDETVLVVDDDEGMRDTLVEVLAANGIHAEGAGSGAAARRQAAVLQAAAAIVDQRLPDCTGIELCAQLKSADTDLQAILLTGYATLETAIAAVGQLDDFLTKPVPPDHLVQVVRSALARRRLSRENTLLLEQLSRANTDLQLSIAARTRDLAGLTTMADAVGKASGIEEVGRAVVDNVADVTGSPAVAVYVETDLPGMLTLAADTGVAGFPARLSSWDEARARLGRDGTVLADLSTADQRVGLLVLQGSDRGRQQLVATMASQAALAVQNAQRLARERETVSRLSELARMKSAFLSSVSHELRTPLAAVVGFTDLLESRWEDLSPADRHHILGRMLVQGGRLRRLIENLLDSTSLETGTLRVEVRPVDLAGAVRRVAEARSDVPGIRLDLAADLPPVSADEGRLEQVLTSLLDNAVRHAGADGALIELSARRAGSTVEVAVADQGPGIEPALASRIFEAFTQGSHAESGQAGGVGLGLHLARGIVEAMGGHIGLDTERELGTRFWLSLPVAPQA